MQSIGTALGGFGRGCQHIETGWILHFSRYSVKYVHSTCAQFPAGEGSSLNCRWSHVGSLLREFACTGSSNFRKRTVLGS